MANLDNPENSASAGRPRSSNIHIDPRSMMVYFSSFNGERIMKQPLNFNNDGINKFC